MATDGDRDRWALVFPASLVPRIIRLVLDSWAVFATSERHEVQITQRFCATLRKNQEALMLPFLIDPEIILPNEDGTAQEGRIDIRFINGYRHKVYFALECKRLRVRQPSGFTSLAGEYVAEGMVRYVSGQYAGGQDVGGMLGYVMDGQVDLAISDVRTAIERRRNDLRMGQNETLRSSSSVDSPHVKESWHKCGRQGQFVLHHVFVNCGELSMNPAGAAKAG